MPVIIITCRYFVCVSVFPHCFFLVFFIENFHFAYKLRGNCDALIFSRSIIIDNNYVSKQLTQAILNLGCPVCSPLPALPPLSFAFSSRHSSFRSDISYDLRALSSTSLLPLLLPSLATRRSSLLIPSFHQVSLFCSLPPHEQAAVVFDL